MVRGYSICNYCKHRTAINLGYYKRQMIGNTKTRRWINVVKYCGFCRTSYALDEAMRICDQVDKHMRKFAPKIKTTGGPIHVSKEDLGKPDSIDFDYKPKQRKSKMPLFEKF